MSSEKWSGGDETGKSESLDADQKNEKKKNRKLSWQETPKIYDPSKVLPKEEVIKLESTEEVPPQENDPYAQASISDGELVAQRKRERRQRGRKLAREHPSSASFRSSHRRVKSLIRFELNDYSLTDIRQMHENMENQQPTGIKSKVSFLKGFTRQQNLVLACLCLVDFTSFCSASIMAPFFPKEAREKGMSEMTSGFVFGFYAFMIFVSSPFFGKILPQVGVKFLFLTGLLVSSTCNLLFGLLDYIMDEWLFCILCFVVQGCKALGCSAYWTTSYVFVGELFPKNIGAILGLTETFVGLGMSIGPAVGGFFFHVGGFGLPFYVLGAVLLLTVPIAFWILPPIQGSSVKKKSGSLLRVMRKPSVLVIGLVVVVSSSVWSFLDPTLEPHLRQFNLTPEKIGMIFLLFSAFYGIFSLIWGYVSDKTGNHWFMMTAGLLVSTGALLLLGPAPFIPFLRIDLRMDLISLGILGSSVALSVLPTFQGLLTAVSRAEGETEQNLSTYSIVAGVWSSLYALGEVIGPLAGGILSEKYGFPMCCTVVAGSTLTLSVVTFIYFVARDCLDKEQQYRYKYVDSDGYDSDCSTDSDDVSRPFLQPDCKNRLYTEENSL